MLAGNLEEALVVGALAFGERVTLPPRGFALGLKRLKRLDFGAAGGKVLVINVFGRHNADVHKRLNGNGGQVRADPVEAHARGNEHAQNQRQADRQTIGSVFLGAGLFALQRVDAVLGKAHRYSRKPSKQRHNPGHPAIGNRHHAQKFRARSTIIGNGMDNINQTEQDDDLHQQRDHGKQWMVVLLLEHRLLLFANGLAVTVILHLDAVDLGHHVHHDDRVLLNPQRHGQQNNLRNEGEQQNGDPPVAR